MMRNAIQNKDCCHCPYQDILLSLYSLCVLQPDLAIGEVTIVPPEKRNNAIA